MEQADDHRVQKGASAGGPRRGGSGASNEAREGIDVKQGIAKAARKDKLLQLLASHGQQARGAVAGYAQARHMVSPQTYRPKPEEPSAQLVRWVQAALCVTLGLRLPLTGTLDAATRAGLLRLQREAGLPQSGAIDTQTLRWLEEQTGVAAPHAEAVAAPWWSDPPSGPLSAPLPPPRDPHAATRSDADAAASPHDMSTAQRPDAVEVPAPQDAAQVEEVPAAAAHTLWRAGERPAAPAAVARMLQREALHGVMTQAFARDWLLDEAERSGRPGTSGVLAELLAWWEEAQNAPQPPLWWLQVQQWAGGEPQKAVDIVRRAWRERTS
jgi:murein L,D-transpeptidase YcbB/YkuD